MGEPDAARRPRRRTKRNAYTGDDMVFALRALEANGGNVTRTARELGIPIATLHQWARGKRVAWHLDGRYTRGGPLPLLWHFRDKPTPVVTSGPTVHLDMTRLTAREHARLRRLIDKARVDPTPP